MKYYLLAVCLSALACGQSESTVYSTDINGHRVAESTTTTSDKGVRTELGQSINNGQVPLQQVEERVLSTGPDGTTTERITRKFDPNGQLQDTERTVIVEQKQPDGGSTVRSTTYRTDINGNQEEALRSTVDTHKQGDSTTTQTVIERPSINGSFETAEKRSAVSTTSGDVTQETETVYRPSQNGDLVEALRQAKEQRKSGDTVTANTAFYEPDVTGTLALARQVVSTTKKNPDGSERSEIDLYARAADGTVQENGAPQQIKEQQIISREKGPGGEVIETLSVRRPTLGDPTHLGLAEKLSETVCTGKCDPATPPPPAAPAGNSRP